MVNMKHEFSSLTTFPISTNSNLLWSKFVVFNIKPSQNIEVYICKDSKSVKALLVQLYSTDLSNKLQQRLKIWSCPIVNTDQIISAEITSFIYKALKRTLIQNQLN